MNFNQSSRIPYALLAAIALAASPSASEAYTLISNLSNTPSAGSISTHFYDNSTTTDTSLLFSSIAQAFTTGSVAVPLRSVTLSMASGGFGSWGFNVGIFNDAGGAPSTIFGAPLTAITTDGDHPAIPGFYSYETPNMMLAVNTTYWLVASTDGDSLEYHNYQWNTTQDFSTDTDTPLGPSGFTAAGSYLLKETALIGPTGAEDTYGGTWDTQAGSTMQFSIDAVPEPSKSLLLMTGLTLTALRRRRKA